MDRPACLALFDPNVPDSFAPQERAGFEQFLDAPPPGYFVAEHEGQIVACGGFAQERICWLIVSREHQGKGLGRFVLLYLLRELGRRNLPFTRLGTTPNIVGFYERFGFREEKRIPDGYAPGYDQVEMVKKMDVCR
jgi:ribosomal protein S18 acetylase RimI-like enzyme